VIASHAVSQGSLNPGNMESADDQDGCQCIPWFVIWAAEHIGFSGAKGYMRVVRLGYDARAI
jgi:hypothetical protein